MAEALAAPFPLRASWILLLSLGSTSSSPPATRVRRLWPSVASSSPVRALDVRARNLAFTDDLSLDDDERCDVSFVSCLADPLCLECFTTMQDRDVAWPTFSSENPCDDVVSLLNGDGLCRPLNGDGAAKDLFCRAYDACMAEGWEDDEAPPAPSGGGLDCDALTECDWEGFHPSFVGDGSCHRQECYNTEVCGYDGGDCCPDTCETDSTFVECGDDHYLCVDPASEYCESSVVRPDRCPGKNRTKAVVECKDGESKYHLSEYDGFGDGWGKTKLIVKEGDLADPGKNVFTGGLKNGFEGYHQICLKPGCYSIITSGGVWGQEVYWELSKGEGSPPLATGSAPVACTFSVGSGACENTCFGMGPDDVMYEDDAWQTFAEMEACIDDKCLIQVGLCKGDKDCAPCLNDDNPSYCKTNKSYITLVQCTLCNCADDPPESCFENKKSESSAGGEGGLEQCTPAETLLGTNAITRFQESSGIDGFLAIMSDWDESHFGSLDAFESCSHTYNEEYAHGGKKALDCMRILASISSKEEDEQTTGNPVPVAIGMIADALYDSPQQFCDCASDANKSCPSCQAFIHFKTLLHESLDACNALDEIDCPAWMEFADPCKKKMIDQFHNIDFNSAPQCDYIQNGCGGVGTFPAFRRLDCGKEIPKNQWDFFQVYQRGCVKDDGSYPPPPIPVPPPSASGYPPPAPHSAHNFPVPSPVAPKPYVPYDKQKPTAYVPDPPEVLPVPDQSTSKPYASSKTKHRFVRSFFFMAVAVMVAFVGYRRYSRQNLSAFQFARYRRQTNEELYGGLFDSQGSGSFEPPTFLPPEDGGNNLT